MSDKTKKPIQGPPQPAPTSSTSSAGANAFGTNQWLLEQLRMQQEGAQESSRPPLAAGMWQELGYRIPQNFPLRRGRHGQLQPELLRQVGIPRLHE